MFEFFNNKIKFYNFYEQKYNLLLTKNDKRIIYNNLKLYFKNDTIRDLKLIEDYRDFIFQQRENEEKRRKHIDNIINN